jgi:hypothetical protein
MGDIEYGKIYEFKVGGIPVTFGRMKQEGGFEQNGPAVFGAALSESELRSERCGYGATEAAAAADLFRLMRPEPDRMF